MVESSVARSSCPEARAKEGPVAILAQTGPPFGVQEAVTGERIRLGVTVVI